MPRSKLLRPSMPLALATLLCACTAHDLAAPHPMPEVQTDHYVEIAPVREADILFVIDNSLSMDQEQANLARNFPAFIDELRKIKGGLPDLHIGVVTTDVGPLAESGCPSTAQNGMFQGWDKACGLQPNNRFIAVSDGEQTRNYQGDLSQVFGCMANVGTRGCGYEHQLEAIRRALTIHGAGESGGFLRKDAYLQIVLITDEDDCSGPTNSQLYGMSFPGEEPSFRCARAGHVCQGRMPPAADFRAPLSQCQPVENGALTNVSAFVDAIRAVKPDPNKVLVAGIFGWPLSGEGEYVVGKRPAAGMVTPGWDYQPICNSANGDATAALRVKQFVESFGKNGTFRSICSDDFRPILADIGQRLAAEFPNLCVATPLLDTKPAAGLQADCVVSESAPANGGYDKTSLPPCDLGAPGSCWKLERNDADCTASGFEVVIDRKGAAPKPETRVEMKCRTCAKADDPRCRR